MRVPDRNSRDSDPREFGNRCSRRVPASHGAPTSSYALDGPSTLHVVRLPACAALALIDGRRAVRFGPAVSVVVLADPSLAARAAALAFPSWSAASVVVLADPSLAARAAAPALRSWPALGVSVVAPADPSPASALPASRTWPVPAVSVVVPADPLPAFALPASKTWPVPAASVVVPADPSPASALPASKTWPVPVASVVAPVDPSPAGVPALQAWLVPAALQAWPLARDALPVRTQEESHREIRTVLSC